MKYPWNLQLNFSGNGDENSENHNVRLHTLSYYCKESYSIQVIGIPISLIAKNRFQVEEYDFEKNDWTLGVSLYIGTYGVDRQLENVKTMLFPMISKEKLKQLDDMIFLLED